MGENDFIIVISIGLCIVAICIIAFCIGRIQNKQYEPKVVETSKRYSDITRLNKEYKFNNVSSKIVYSKTLNTKQMFDKFDLDGYFQQMVELNMSELRQKKAYLLENATLKKSYDSELQNIHGFADEEYVKKLKLSWKRYHEVELELCNLIEKNPPQNIEIICYKLYTSPKGQNSYTQNKRFFSYELEKAFQKAIESKKIRESKEYQRRTMSDSLRYDILKRDGFRCVLCGRSAADGVKLHVDHIKPIAKGGKTVEFNLRTLCEHCNWGKSDKFDSDGVN